MYCYDINLVICSGHEFKNDIIVLPAFALTCTHRLSLPGSADINVLPVTCLKISTLWYPKDGEVGLVFCSTSQQLSFPDIYLTHSQP